MTFEAYFRIASYGLVATAFAALVLTRELDAVSIILYSMALGLSFYADMKSVTRWRLREWMWRTLAIAYIPLVFVDAATTSHVMALVHMTLFLSAAKLFQHKRERDWVFLYVLAFFQMLLAAGLTFDSVFIVSLIVFLFFFISTLAAFEIRLARREIKVIDEEIIPRARKARWAKYRAKESGATAGKPVAGAPLGGRVRYLVGASFAQVVLVLALTLPFFFMIPRFGGGIARGFVDPELRTGFSDTVQLGQVAKIKESQRVVMRVKLNRRPAKFIRWRGVALEHYSGDTWSVARIRDRISAEDQVRSTGGDGRAGDNDFDRDYPTTTISPSDRQFLVEQKGLEQQILLEAHTTGTLFAAQRLIRVRGPFPSLTLDKYTGAISTVGLKGRVQYTAWSDVTPPDEQVMRADPHASYPDKVLQCLQLPDGRNGSVRLDPRIAQRAEEITRNALTPYDKARAIESYLKKFDYTLEPKIGRGDPLAEFLFDVREGHCEYFATAMAIMLRTLQIPARVVNGFQMGEYNDINDLYTVRERDAHSWVEVYFPLANAWVEFDPTPPAGFEDYSQGGVLASLRKYLEAAEVFWLDYIVTLDGEEQATMMVDLQQRLLKVKDRVSGYYLGAKDWVRGVISSIFLDRSWSLSDVLKVGGLVGLLLLVTGSAYVAATYAKRRRLSATGYGPWWHRLFILPAWRSARLAGRNPRASAVMFYEQMLAIAARAGLVKQPYQTPVEFAALSGFPQIEEITAVYNRVRFGGARLDESEARRVSRLLAELRRAASERAKKSRMSRRRR